MASGLALLPYETMGLTLHFSLVRGALNGPPLLSSLPFTLLPLLYLLSSSLFLPPQPCTILSSLLSPFLGLNPVIMSTFEWAVPLQRDEIDPCLFGVIGLGAAIKWELLKGAWGYLGKWQLVKRKGGWPQASASTLSSLKPSPCEL